MYQPGSYMVSRPPSAVRAFIFLAIRIQPFLSLVDREVEFCVRLNRSPLDGHILFYFYLVFFSEKKSQLPGFELTSYRVKKVTRLPTEL